MGYIKAKNPKQFVPKTLQSTERISMSHEKLCKNGVEKRTIFIVRVRSKSSK